MISVDPDVEEANAKETEDAACATARPRCYSDPGQLYDETYFDPAPITMHLIETKDTTYAIERRQCYSDLAPPYAIPIHRQIRHEFVGKVSHVKEPETHSVQYKKVRKDVTGSGVAKIHIVMTDDNVFGPEEPRDYMMSHNPAEICDDFDTMRMMSHNPAEICVAEPARRLCVEVDSVSITHPPLQEQRRVNHLIAKAVDRFLGILDVPRTLIFGIILYLVDIGSDILAAIDHFQEGHPIWGSLALTFVVLPALCWAAVSWSWWYTYDPNSTKSKECSVKISLWRKIRMLLAVLLLDPLTR